MASGLPTRLVAKLSTRRLWARTPVSVATTLIRPGRTLALRGRIRYSSRRSETLLPGKRTALVWPHPTGSSATTSRVAHRARGSTGIGAVIIPYDARPHEATGEDRGRGGRRRGRRSPP